MFAALLNESMHVPVSASHLSELVYIPRLYTLDHITEKSVFPSADFVEQFPEINMGLW